MVTIALFFTVAAMSADGQETRRSADSTSTKAVQAADAAVEALIDLALVAQTASGVTLSTLVATSAEAELALRQKVAEQAHLSNPRTMPDGAVEVDAWATAKDLAAILTSGVAPHLPQSNAEFFRLGPIEEGYLIATGCESPSSGAEVPGWRHLSRQELLLVERAATIDAGERLRTRLLALNMDNGETLDRRTRPSRAPADSVEQLIRKAAIGTAQFEPYGVCQIVVELRREAVNKALPPRPGDDSLPTIEATGFAVAPLRVPGQRTTVYDSDSAPKWATQTLTAHATGQAPHATGPATRPLASTAAYLEASRRLCLQIESLPLPEGDTVGQRLLAHPQFLDQIEGAFLSTTSPAADAIRVELSIPLKRVWALLKSTSSDR